MIDLAIRSANLIKWKKKYLIQTFIMRERNYQNTHCFKSSFLQKFAGKLNVLTKDGEIREQNHLKLPIINSPQSKRISTMKFRSSKQSSHSFFSDIRTQASLSVIENNPSAKFFKSKMGRHHTEISNPISKHPSTHTLKKTGIKTFQKENLASILFAKKQSAELGTDDWKEPQSMEATKINKNHNRNYDYETFLHELNSINSSVQHRKGHSKIKAQDRKGSWTQK